MHLELGDMEYLKLVVVFSEIPLFKQSNFCKKRAQTEPKTSGQKLKHEQNLFNSESLF